MIRTIPCWAHFKYLLPQTDALAMLWPMAPWNESLTVNVCPEQGRNKFVTLCPKHADRNRVVWHRVEAQSCGASGEIALSAESSGGLKATVFYACEVL